MFWWLWWFRLQVQLENIVKRIWIMMRFELIELDTWIYFRCSASFKCCWINACNRSCIMPENLSHVSTFILPPIPTNVTVQSMEHEYRRKAKMSWLMRLPHNRCEEQIDYIVEARMHIGHYFARHKLGQWFVIPTENLHLELMHSHNSK